MKDPMEPLKEAELSVTEAVTCLENGEPDWAELEIRCAIDALQETLEAMAAPYQETPR